MFGVFRVCFKLRNGTTQGMSCGGCCPTHPLKFTNLAHANVPEYGLQYPMICMLSLGRKTSTWFAGCESYYAVRHKYELERICKHPEKPQTVGLHKTRFWTPEMFQISGRRSPTMGNRQKTVLLLETLSRTSGFVCLWSPQPPKSKT